ncbi:pyridoxamine 5'-phosphate oxidase [Streptosporangium canum]|uniref:Pyridoxamine 5'-phosphate oxidase n=1 Tax=Streptosporangium canum TaxID=324952 RepID=A0A1I3JH35_9ACTN|nr:pyridoxamine 5'-phosphate oxidase [Streptosporangium canum]SFI59288.1 Pyridoxamine 5'-phosphate oxidase [Streptosporangium canum]
MSTTTDLIRLGASYRRDGVDPGKLESDPLAQFRHWHDEWLGTGPAAGQAAVLATADIHGRPSARWVDLAYVDHGFVFFTNYGSRKSADLAVNPQAALCFGWLEVGRQVRAEGGVARLTDVESDAFFAGLPRGVQLLSWASDQRRVVGDRDVLQAQLAQAGDRFSGQEVPRPAHWGGYRLTPEEVEFWQRRTDEIQDRFRYRREIVGDGWRSVQIAP